MNFLIEGNNLPPSFLEVVKVNSLKGDKHFYFKEMPTTIVANENISLYKKETDFIKITFCNDPLSNFEQSSVPILLLKDTFSFLYGNHRSIKKQLTPVLNKTKLEVNSNDDLSLILLGQYNEYVFASPDDFKTKMSLFFSFLDSLDKLEEKKQKDNGVKNYFLRMFVKTSVSRKHFNKEDYFLNALIDIKNNPIIYLSSNGDYKHFDKLLNLLSVN